MVNLEIKLRFFEMGLEEWVERSQGGEFEHRDKNLDNVPNDSEDPIEELLVFCSIIEFVVEIDAGVLEEPRRKQRGRFGDRDIGVDVARPSFDDKIK